MEKIDDPRSDGGEVTVVVDVCGRRCALPAQRVLEVLAAVLPTPLPGAPDVVVGVVNRRGDVVAVLDMRRRFALPPRPLALSDCLVVVEATGRTLALLVDAVVEVVTVGKDDIDRAAASATEAAYSGGVAVLPDGLVVIADLDAFLSRREAVALDEAMAAAAGEGRW